MRCIAGILIGGQSRRMGQPKGSLELPSGRTMIEYLVRVVEPLADEIVLLGEGVDVPAGVSDIPVLADMEPGRGPLGGLCTLLDRAAPGWGLLVGCDYPRLEATVPRRLLSEAGEEYDAVAFVEPGTTQKLTACCALYHSSILETAIDILRRGRGGPQALLAQVRVRRLEANADEARMLKDVDTPEEFEKFLQDPEERQP